MQPLSGKCAIMYDCVSVPLCVLCSAGRAARRNPSGDRTQVWVRANLCLPSAGTVPQGNRGQFSWRRGLVTSVEMASYTIN